MKMPKTRIKEPAHIDIGQTNHACIHWVDIPTMPASSSFQFWSVVVDYHKNAIA